MTTFLFVLALVILLFGNVYYARKCTRLEQKLEVERSMVDKLCARVTAVRHRSPYMDIYNALEKLHSEKDPVTLHDCRSLASRIMRIK